MESTSITIELPRHTKEYLAEQATASGYSSDEEYVRSELIAEEIGRRRQLPNYKQHCDKIPKRSLVLEVAVVEMENDRNVISRLCSHSESIGLPWGDCTDEEARNEYCKHAYNGFIHARNGMVMGE